MPEGPAQVVMETGLQREKKNTSLALKRVPEELIKCYQERPRKITLGMIHQTFVKVR